MSDGEGEVSVPEETKPQAAEPTSPDDPVLASTPEGEEDEVELIEWDDDGKKFKVPAPLKDHLLRNADYTKKAQSLAEERRSFAAERETIQKADNAYLETVGTLAHAESRINEWYRLNGVQPGQKIDWATVARTDPARAAKAFGELQQLEQARDNSRASVEQRKAELKASQATGLNKRLEETAAFAEKNIPGWTPKLDEDIERFAVAQGYSKAEAQERMSPAFYRTLYLAMLGDKAQKAAAKTLATVPASDVSPLRQLNPRGGGAGRPLAKVDNMDEYVRRRKAGEKG